MSDPEIDAMGKVLAALTQLDEPARVRVIKWASEKLGVLATAEAPAAVRSTMNSVEPRVPEPFRDLPDLFDAASPESDVEKALVAAYWAQVGQANPSFGSQALNDELKQLGHPIGNITRALDNLMAGKPALIQQLRKEGNTKQARKTYRLTSAGVRKVESMVRNAGSASIEN